MYQAHRGFLLSREVAETGEAAPKHKKMTMPTPQRWDWTWPRKSSGATTLTGETIQDDEMPQVQMVIMLPAAHCAGGPGRPERNPTSHSISSLSPSCNHGSRMVDGSENRVRFRHWKQHKHFSGGSLLNVSHTLIKRGMLRLFSVPAF